MDRSEYSVATIFLRAVGTKKPIFSRTSDKNQDLARSDPSQFVLADSCSGTFLHTSNGFLMKMRCCTIQMAPQKHDFVTRLERGSTRNFMIFVLVEPRKVYPRDVASSMLTFALKPPTGVTILLAKHQNHKKTQGTCRFFER